MEHSSAATTASFAGCKRMLYKTTDSSWCHGGSPGNEGVKVTGCPPHLISERFCGPAGLDAISLPPGQAPGFCPGKIDRKETESTPVQIVKIDTAELRGRPYWRLFVPFFSFFFRRGPNFFSFFFSFLLLSWMLTSWYCCCCCSLLLLVVFDLLRPVYRAVFVLLRVSLLSP